MAFADATHGWLGGAGVILATSDGGRTWQTQWSGAGKVIEMTVLGRSHAWAIAAHVADDGTISAPEILRTSDGGARWTATRLSHGLGSLDFVTPSVGWAIELGSTAPAAYPGGGPLGRLVRTADGGRTWTDAGAGTVATVCFLDARHGWATGGSVVRRTLDGGRTWRVVSKRPDEAFAFDRTLACQGGALWLFQDLMGGAGGHSNYAGWRSTDGGRTWRQVMSNAFFDLKPTSIGHADDEPGPFVAPNPSTSVELGVSPAAQETSVTITLDGGRTWRTTTLVGLAAGGEIAFPDPRHGYVLGWDHGQRDVLLATSDGGRTWSERWPTTTPSPVDAIAFVSPTVGFGLGVAGDARSVLMSVNAGASWTGAGELPEPADTWIGDPNRLSFTDASHGWVATSAGHVLATTDGGRSWRRVTLPTGMGPITEVAFADPLRGCVAAIASDTTSKAEASTGDGGRTWTPVPGTVQPVAACARGEAGRSVAAAAAGRTTLLTPQLTFLDDRTAWLLTDLGLDWTADGGATWDGVGWPSPQLPNGESAFGGPFEVTFASPTEGWMLADDGSIFRTTDGGRSWSELPLDVPALACTADQLEVTSVGPAAGLGTVSAWLRFTNASDRRCSLRGWPTLVGVLRSGATSVARRSNVPLTLPVDIGPQAVTLGPGDSALAEYESSDNPVGTATTCQSYRTLRVTAPGTSRAVTLSAWNAWLGGNLPACIGIEVSMVVSEASVSQLANGPTAGTPPPALTVDHPALVVSPSSHLRDGQAVEVRVTGFGVGGKVFLSECASAAAASDLGCGAQLAAQTLLVTDDSRAGHASFIVSSSASADPLGSGGLQRCGNPCVLVATLGGGYPFVVAPISFDAP